ncbi:MAG: hypothetical protein ISR49_14890 [Alphaproteobacteria bacterium]|nr:hypothetical protein [Alphaproteobacteria bacterium]
MLDAVLSRAAAPYLAPAGARLSSSISTTVATVAAFVSGAAALPAIGFRKYWLALGLLVLRAILDVLAGAIARAKPPTAAEAALDRTLDLVLSAAVPFAFALAMPDRALAAMFLLLGLVVRAGSTDVVAEEVVGKTELLIAFALGCIFPDRFSIVAYVIGVLCFVGAGRRLAQAVFS